MQGRTDPQREVFDVESVAGHLLPSGSIYAFLAEHRGRLFPPLMFEDLFPSGLGRASVPGDVVATTIVLQTLNGVQSAAMSWRNSIDTQNLRATCTPDGSRACEICC